MVNGDQMNMGMGYFESYHRYSYAFTGAYLLEALCYDLGKYPKPHILIVFYVEKVIGLPLGDNQYMTFGQWVNIQKSQVIVALSYFVRRYLTGYDF